MVRKLGAGAQGTTYQERCRLPLFPLSTGRWQENNANNEPNDEMLGTSLTLSRSAVERTKDQPGGWIEGRGA